MRDVQADRRVEQNSKVRPIARGGPLNRVIRPNTNTHQDRGGNDNDNAYRLLVQGLRHRQASAHLTSREGYARENS